MLAIVLGVALGAAIEFVLLRRLRGADIDTTMLVMIGAWIAMQNTEQLVWSGVAKSIDNPFPAAPLVIGPVSVSWNRLFVFCVALRADRRDLRAHQPHPARQGDARDLPGPRHGGADGRPDRPHPHRHLRARLGPRGGGRRAARAGVRRLRRRWAISPPLKAFAIVILGGLGSIAGATIGGFILAFVEELGAGYISSGYRDAMGFLLIILILLFEPTGLFAQKERIG